MTRRFIYATVSVLVVFALVSLSGCERPKSTGPQLTMPAQSAATATPTAKGGIPAPVQTTVVAQATAAATATKPVSVVAISTATPKPAAPTAAPLPTAVPGAPKTHVVKAGEWLFSIARQYNVSPQSIAQANNLIDPGSLTPGQTLLIPAPGTSPSPAATAQPGGQTTHKVQTGENLFRIALKYNKTVQEVAAANGITNLTLIYPGQVLIIP